MQPPIATVAPVTASHVGLAVQLDGSQSISLRPDQSLSYTWSFLALPPRSHATLNDVHLARPSFTPDVPGTYALRLVVDDGILAASSDVTVTVADDCRPVIKTLAQMPEAPTVGQTTGLSVTAQSSCGTNATIVAYQWTLVSAPAGSKAQLLLATTAAPSFTPDVRGDYDLAVQVTDSLGLISDSSLPAAHLRYSTRPCGDNLPVVAGIAPSIAGPAVGVQVQLTATVTDADNSATCGFNRALRYAWRTLEVPAGSLARLNGTTVEKPSFIPDLHGRYRFGLTVTDDLGRASAEASVEVDTTLCGDATPTAAASATPGLTVATGTSVQLHTTVHDTDNPAYDGTDVVGGPATSGTTGCQLALTWQYAWQMVSAPLGSKAALNNTSLANPTFVADVPGTYQAAVIAIASTGHASAPAFINVTVQQCGSVAPAVAINAPASGITSQPVALAATVTDTNSACYTVTPDAFAWSIVQAPAGSRAQLSGAAQSAPSFVPDVGGDYVIGLSVADAIGLRATAAVATVHVASCNQPLAVALASTGRQTAQPVSLTAQVTDPNDPATSTCTAPVSPLKYAWTMVGQPAGSVVALNSATDAQPSFVPDVSGRYTVQLVATDAAGNASAPATLDVDVGACSQPLSAVITAPGGASTGVPLPLTAVVTDPNLKSGNPACWLVDPLLTYQWTMTAQPAGSRAVLNNANASNPSFVPDVGGLYTVTLVATDAAGNRTPATQVSVGVNVCDAPIAVAPSASAPLLAGQLVTLNAGAVDPNDHANNASCTTPVAPLSYAWQLVGLPAGSRASFNDAAARAPSITPDALGAYTAQVTVTDAAGNTGTGQVSFSVGTACNQPLTPGLLTVAPAAPKVGSAPFTVDLKPSSITDNNDTSCPGATTPHAYTWQWSLVSRPPKSAAGIADPNVEVASIVADVPGDYVLQVRVADELGNAGTATKVVSVSSCQTGGQPGVTATASAAAPELGQPVTLNAVVADQNASGCGAPTAAPFSYAWTLTGPAASSATLANARNTTASFVPDVAGVYAYAVTVTDALGFQGTATGTVTAASCAMTIGGLTGASGVNTFSTQQLNANVTFAAGCATPPAVSYAWTFDALPAGSASVFNNPSVKNPSFLLDRPNGSWTARVTVTDSVSGAQATAAATFTTSGCGGNTLLAKIGTGAPAPVVAPVNHASPPSSADNAATLTHPVSVQLDGLSGLPATPPNSACGGSAYSYKWVLWQLPPGSAAAINPVTAALPTITLDVAGDYVFQLTVTDGIVTSAPTYFRLHAN